MRFILLFIYVVFVVCCSNNKNTRSEGLTGNEIRYAQGFKIKEYDNYSIAEVYNPWTGYSLLARYIFISNGKVPGNIDGTTIQVPIKRGVFLSSTYLGMISMLGSQDAVCASASANWIYDSVLYNNFKCGKLTNLGNDLSIDPEAVIAQSPDVVMKYIYLTADPTDEVLKNAGIPVIYNIEFMEKHPLGRAEWIKLVGLLTNKKHQADSIFNVIENNYKYYNNIAHEAKERPSVLIGNSYKGSWFTVGGNSYVAQLVNDANAEYYWSYDSSSGSLPLGFEAILQKQRDASFWINANAASLNEIASIETRCAMLKSFRAGNVYHYNKRVNAEGGLDYYETGVVRPDLLLHDLILIFHPELFNPSEQTVYWKKLD